jgi:hypothetical protein
VISTANGRARRSPPSSCDDGSADGGSACPWRRSEALGTFPSLGIRGGVTYDALIGATAARAGATLVSLDERALSVYAAVGADVDLSG